MKRLQRHLVAATLAIFAACESSGSGCNGCNGIVPVSYPSPAPLGGKLQADVVRARLTTTGLEFFRKHLDLLLGAFLSLEGDNAVYYIDEAMLPADSPVLLRDGCIGPNSSNCSIANTTHKSKLQFNLTQLRDNLQLTWLPAVGGEPGLRFALSNFDLYVDLAMVTQTGLASLDGAACHIRDAGQLAAIHVGELAFDVRLKMSGTNPPQLSGRTENIIFNLGDTTENSALHLQVSACEESVDPDCNDPVCQADLTQCEDVCHLLDLFAQLGGFLTEILNPLLDQLAPTVAGFVSDAMVSALASLPLQIETQLDLAQLVGPVFSASEPLAVKVSASPNLQVAGNVPGRGLEVGLDGGVAATAPASCVIPADPPDLTALSGPPPDYSGFLEVVDADGNSHMEAYHVAVSASQGLFAQAAWNLYTGGGLCIGLDAHDVERLVGSSFSFTAGLLQTFDQHLDDLADPQSPLSAIITPTSPPVLKLGAGRDVADGVHESLFELTLNDVGIELYMQVDDAPTRITGLTTDIVVKLGVERTALQSLEVVVEGIDIFDVREYYNELAPGADLAGMVKLVADLALDTFLGDNLRFGVNVDDILASALGLPVHLRINGVRRDFGTTGVPYLSLYATLCDDAELQNPENLACYQPDGGTARQAGLAVRIADENSLYVPPDRRRFGPRWTAAPSGKLALRVDVGGDANGYLYQYRVDGGLWSGLMPAPDGVLEVQSARLLVVAQHTVEVRAREISESYGRFTTTQRLRFWVDRERPRLRTRVEGDILDVFASDLGSGDDVEVWARASGDNDFSLVESGSIDIAGKRGSIELVARDLAGNSTRKVVTLGDAAAGTRPVNTNADTAAQGGCEAAGGPSLLALFGSLLCLRRRRYG